MLVEGVWSYKSNCVCGKLGGWASPLIQNNRESSLASFSLSSAETPAPHSRIHKCYLAVSPPDFVHINHHNKMHNKMDSPDLPIIHSTAAYATLSLECACYLQFKAVAKYIQHFTSIKDPDIYYIGTRPCVYNSLILWCHTQDTFELSDT